MRDKELQVKSCTVQERLCDHVTYSKLISLPLRHDRMSLAEDLQGPEEIASSLTSRHNSMVFIPSEIGLADGTAVICSKRASNPAVLPLDLGHARSQR